VLLTAEETEPPPLVVAPAPAASPIHPAIPVAEPLPRAGDEAAILTDGAFFSLMVGLGETYLPAFALALGASYLPKGLEIVAGLLAAIPIFLGAVFQLVTPYCVRRLGSHRRWCIAAVGCQATSLLLLPVVLLLHGWSIPLLFLIATLYWGSGLSSNPAWNTWMEDLVPAASRTHFFARRVRICQFCTMLGFVIGGLLLEFGQRGDWLMPAFVAVFVVAAVSRYVSTGLIARTSEPDTARCFTQSHVGLSEISRRLGSHSGMRVLWFLFAMQASVQLSGPYFTPFMLRRLGLGYHEFMLLIVLGFAGKVVALRTWGKLATKMGARTLLWIGGVSIVPVSGVWIALWWIEHPMLYLCVVQFVGGIAWAAYELGFFLIFFEAIPRSERTSVLTIYNFGNSAALLVGASCGATWLAWQGETHHAFLILFLISSVSRLLSLLLLKRISVPGKVIPAPA
jgi:MFS family permease